jgi:tRNA pseudouridine(38-40) synthase
MYVYTYMYIFICDLIFAYIYIHTHFFQVLGWTEVTPDFSSRFSCASRKYRYFFVKRDLNIEAMGQAASLLIGDHDFRNICKIDIAKVSNFRREVNIYTSMYIYYVCVYIHICLYI